MKTKTFLARDNKKAGSGALLPAFLKLANDG